MNPYALIDLHCDTLTDCIHKGLTPDTLDDPGRVLSLSSLPSDVHWAQFYAIFIPDQHRGQAAIDYYETNRDNFNRQMEKFHDRISPLPLRFRYAGCMGGRKDGCFSDHRGRSSSRR